MRKYLMKKLLSDSFNPTSKNNKGGANALPFLRQLNNITPPGRRVLALEIMLDGIVNAGM